MEDLIIPPPRYGLRERLNDLGAAADKVLKAYHVPGQDLTAVMRDLKNTLQRAFQVPGRTS